MVKFVADRSRSGHIHISGPLHKEASSSTVANMVEGPGCSYREKPVARRRAESDKDVKVPRLSEQDDIVSYLTMLERIMVAFE